jgi:hypothetical protein
LKRAGSQFPHFCNWFFSSCFKLKVCYNVKCSDCPDIAGFTWDEYLLKTKSQAVPARAFKPVSNLCLTIAYVLRCHVSDVHP